MTPEELRKRLAELNRLDEQMAEALRVELVGDADDES